MGGQAARGKERRRDDFVAPPSSFPLAPNTESFSGAYRDRTDDLLVANQALSQLS